MTEKTYRGSCHCKAITYEVKLDLAKGTGKCNCTFCSKSRNWGAFVKPADFTLLSGKDQLASYAGRNPTGHQYFCKTCGVRTHGDGVVEEIGGAYVSVQVATLDDVDAKNLLEGQVRFANGRDNDWMNTPAFTAHL
ncbi:MAG: aldehyde-activating protein [Archangium gephyra]|uniref:Aldehyde-activating protein n=1 Tax=Archangium gephyra TaxID=48 RepID=A0A2W5THH6_9BACT|nr:MAG: aldehyde-activating protein [Archangium gephyra]